jgi:cytoskeletal protein CcmA (bactofilin family)
MSVFCRHCSRRLVVEDFQIKNFHASRTFDTCGTVTVEKRGMLAALVRVQNLVVKGKVKGDIEARERVEVHRTGEVLGNVTAPALVVQTGGLIQGDVRIGPCSEPA